MFTAIGDADFVYVKFHYVVCLMPQKRGETGQNTTNALDRGCFSLLKNLLGIHGGISRETKRKITLYYLETV